MCSSSVYIRLCDPHKATDKLFVTKRFRGRPIEYLCQRNDKYSLYLITLVVDVFKIQVKLLRMKFEEYLEFVKCPPCL
jgi:hypothetical protein